MFILWIWYLIFNLVLIFILLSSIFDLLGNINLLLFAHWSHILIETNWQHVTGYLLRLINALPQLTYRPHGTTSWRVVFQLGQLHQKFIIFKLLSINRNIIFSKYIGSGAWLARDYTWDRVYDVISDICWFHFE